MRMVVRVVPRRIGREKKVVKKVKMESRDRDMCLLCDDNDDGDDGGVLDG